MMFSLYLKLGAIFKGKENFKDLAIVAMSVVFVDTDLFLSPLHKNSTQTHISYFKWM